MHHHDESLFVMMQEGSFTRNGSAEARLRETLPELTHMQAAAACPVLERPGGARTGES